MNRNRKSIFLAFALAMFIFNGEVQSQFLSSPIKDFDEKPWEELKLQLPVFPKEPNLKEIDVGPVTSFRFYVDMESVVVGTDGVVRFSLVARSGAGASNVSFEGLRCEPQERKIYSFGRPDGTWSEAKNPRWVELVRQAVNPVHTVLYEDYFCPGRRIVSSSVEAVDAVRYGGHPRGRTKGR
ncbi:MAG: CNP1-like family protein [Burkholderiales bacterium]